MNTGLMRKSLRELWPATMMAGLLVGLFECLIAILIPRFSTQMNMQILEMPFLKRIVEGMLGTRLAEKIGPEIIWSIPWTHPVMLALLLSHAVITTTRFPAGEIDRGTIDITLGLPISRRQWIVTDTFLWLISAMCIVGVLVVGNRVGSAISGTIHQINSSELLAIYFNLLGVYLAFGAIGWLISTFSDRRGRAMTITFLLIVMSVLVSFLEQFWEPARYAAYFSALSYNRPVYILRDHTWPVFNLCVLYVSAAVIWTVAVWWFTRRDLCTT